MNFAPKGHNISAQGRATWRLSHVAPGNAQFYWQHGYAAFSVSESNCDKVRKYIQNQEDHHRKMTFQDELRLILKRHRIEFDERYVWD